MIKVKQKIALTLFVFLLIFSALFFFFLSPFYRRVSSVAKMIGLQKSVFGLLEERVVDLDKLKKEARFYSELSDDLEKIFVNQEAPIDFLSFLEKKAKESKVKMNASIFSSPPSADEEEDHLVFRVSCECGFDKCFSFFNAIEMSEWVLEIEKAQISKVSEKDLRQTNVSIGTLPANYASLSFEVKVYSY